MCSDTSTSESPHLPSSISSTGHLSLFRRSRKPVAAGSATNCLSCPIEKSCKYSARRIYVDRHLRKGITDWPVKVVNPEIEDCYRTNGPSSAEDLLLSSLAQDYTSSTPPAEIDRRPWFGRCVWESANDVCDDQTVNMSWDDGDATKREYAKTATFHMIAHTEAQCERRGVVYGTDGEITYDSKTIRVYYFATGQTQLFHPKQMPGGHGGGDDGLIQQFIGAVEAVMHGNMTVEQAQREFVGCTLEDVVRSHAAVFAAEEARRTKTVVDWKAWWAREVEKRLMEIKGWDVINGA